MRAGAQLGFCTVLHRSSTKEDRVTIDRGHEHPNDIVTPEGHTQPDMGGCFVL